MLFKKPMFIDLVYGIVGTYLYNKEDKEGYIIPIYVPLNGFRKVEYPHPIPRDVLEHVDPPDGDHKGMCKQYVVIRENTAGEHPFMDQIGIAFENQIKRYREQTRSQKLELTKERQRSKKATAESNRQLAREHEARKSRLGDDNQQSPMIPKTWAERRRMMAQNPPPPRY